MLFKPELNETAKAAGKSVFRSVLRRMVSISITLLILGGLGYIGNVSIPAKDFQNKIQSSGTTGTFGGTAPLEFRALLPCFSFGFDFLVL